MSEQDEQRAKATAEMRAAYEAGEFTIDAHTYKVAGTTHKKRQEIFAFYSSVMPFTAIGNYMFITTPEFERVEKLFSECITLDGIQVSKLADHWEKFPKEYIRFIVTAMGVLSFPFMEGVLISSSPSSDPEKKSATT